MSQQENSGINDGCIPLSGGPSVVRARSHSELQTLNGTVYSRYVSGGFAQDCEAVKQMNAVPT